MKHVFWKIENKVWTLLLFLFYIKSNRAAILFITNSNLWYNNDKTCCAIYATLKFVWDMLVWFITLAYSQYTKDKTVVYYIGIYTCHQSFTSFANVVLSPCKWTVAVKVLIHLNLYIPPEPPDALIFFVLFLTPHSQAKGDLLIQSSAGSFLFCCVMCGPNYCRKLLYRWYVVFY
jgi:hypothetical protein